MKSLGWSSVHTGRVEAKKQYTIKMIVQMTTGFPNAPGNEIGK